MDNKLTELSKPVAWSGWACQFPGHMPRLYGDRAIAEINCDYDGGARLLFLSSGQPAPAHAVAWEMRYWNSGHNCWHDWERITAEQHAEMSVQHMADNDYEFRVLYDAPPAPVNASPDFEAWFVEKYKQPDRLVKNEDGTYKFSGVQMAFTAWNACRAAMLAAAPDAWIACSERMPLPVAPEASHDNS